MAQVQISLVESVFKGIRQKLIAIHYYTIVSNKYIIYIYIYILFYDMQFTQKNKNYNHQILSKYACTWKKNKNEEVKEINTSTKVNKK